MNNARAVPVLMYHHVSPAAGAVTVSQMAMLARDGYTTLGAAALGEYLAGKPVPERSVVLTFDDGYLDNWVHVHPVLARHGFTAVGFLVSAWVNSGPVRPNAANSASPLNLPGHSAAKAAIQAGDTDQAIMHWSEIDAMRQSETFEFHSQTCIRIRARLMRIVAASLALPVLVGIAPAAWWRWSIV
ncbi:Polysaccharide deacetylase [Candidatus Burkholderia crenata]|nr:Polysaccharide deacetylase [Candidatus Burkholderia crenata]